MDYYYLERNHPIALSDLVSLEALENYTVFRLLNGTKIVSSTTLKRHQEKITPECFIRVNRQVVVNLGYVEKFLNLKGSYFLQLTDGRLIRVSRRRQRYVVPSAS